MTKDKKRGSRQKSGNSPSPSPPSKGNNVEGQLNTQPKVNDCRYVTQESPNIYVHIPPVEKEKKWSLANKIAVWGTVINLCLGVLTFLLFIEASSTLKEYKTEFRSINEPYLQITIPRMERFEGFQKIVIKYDIVNLKEYPIQVVGEKTITTFGPLDSLKEFYDRFQPKFNTDFNINELRELRNQNKYIIKDEPLKDSAFTLDNITPDVVDSANTGTFWIVFLGGVRYKNLVTNAQRTYWYEVALKPNLITGGWYHWYVHNENVSAPPEER